MVCAAVLLLGRRDQNLVDNKIKIKSNGSKTDPSGLPVPK